MYYLDYEKPLKLKPDDITDLQLSLSNFNYSISENELQLLAKRKYSVFMREKNTNTIKGYADICVRGKNALLDWIFAPKLGNEIMPLIIDYIKIQIPKVENVKLIIEVDKKESNIEKMTKARFNLYFKSGFVIEKVTFVKDVAIYVMIYPCQLKNDQDDFGV